MSRRQRIAVGAVLVGLLSACCMLGCGGKPTATVAPEPFKKAIAEYLERNNMAMALKEIKEGPAVEDKTATLTASLTHATLSGPAVTWQFRFEKAADGSWKAVSHR